MSFFQILAPNGSALEDQRENSDSDSDPIFTKNELKENQFWYLDIVPGSDYGYIGSKKYPGRTNQVFTLGTCFEATRLDLRGKVRILFFIFNLIVTCFSYFLTFLPHRHSSNAALLDTFPLKMEKNRKNSQNRQNLG